MFAGDSNNLNNFDGHLSMYQASIKTIVLVNDDLKELIIAVINFHFIMKHIHLYDIQFCDRKLFFCINKKQRLSTEADFFFRDVQVNANGKDSF